MGIVLPEQGEAFVLGNIGLLPFALYALAVWQKVLLPFVEGTTGAIDGLEVADVTIQDERLPRSEIVEKPTPPHNVVQFFVG